MDYGDYVEIGTGDVTFNSATKVDVDMGNMVLLDIEPERRNTEIIGGKEGIAIDVKQKIIAMQMTLGMDKFTATILGISFGVEIAAITGGSGNLPKTVPFIIYKDKPAFVCGGGYVGIDGVALSSVPSDSAPDFIEGTDFETMEATGQVIAMEGGGIANGATVFIQAGTYTIVTADRLKFPKGFINSKGHWKFEKELDAGGSFIAEIWNGYVSEGPTLALKPDGTTEFQITVRSLQDDTHSAEELTRIDFEA